ncbi:hypothetical protein M1432_00635 [Patescibacteria group bacterium]|nr:hypothetical protein [Patescibacteria group bacterium]
MSGYETNLKGLGRQLDPRGIRTANFGRLKGIRPDAVIVCGMGGSGLVGDFLQATAAEIRLPVPVTTVKTNGLPALPFKRPLYVCISFSGETAETLDCLKAALRTKAKSGVAVVTGQGGKMRKIAEEYRLPAAYFEAGDLTPRTASGNMYTSLTTLLRGTFPGLAVPDLSRSIRSGTFSRQGAVLARRLRGRNIIVYADASHSALGYFWKIGFNETGKNAAFANTYPEIDHNEIVGFGKIRGAWAMIWLVDPEGDSENRSKAAFVAKRMERKGIRSVQVKLRGKTALQRFWNGVALAEWTAFHLAGLNGVRPEETKAIDELKSKFK